MLCILVTAVFDGHLHALVLRDLELSPHCLQPLLYAHLWLLKGKEGGREGGERKSITEGRKEGEMMF